MIINYCETIYLCQIALIKGIVSKLHKSSVHYRYIRQFSWPLMSFVSVKIFETNHRVGSFFKYSGAALKYCGVVVVAKKIVRAK